MQILNNADIFYETQYKEVKIVANVSDLSSEGCWFKTSHPVSWLLEEQAVFRMVPIRRVLP